MLLWLAFGFFLLVVFYILKRRIGLPFGWLFNALLAHPPAAAPVPLATPSPAFEQVEAAQTEFDGQVQAGGLDTGEAIGAALKGEL